VNLSAEFFDLVFIKNIALVFLEGDVVVEKITPPNPNSLAKECSHSGISGVRNPNINISPILCVMWRFTRSDDCPTDVRLTLESGHVRCNYGCPLWANSGHGARVKRSCWLQAYAYLEVVSGSIPLFVIASEARAEARNSISRLEPSMLPEPATTAAENV
jgi:hypothetical protein